MKAKKVKRFWEAQISAYRVMKEMDTLFKLFTAISIIADDLNSEDECNRYRCATALSGIGEVVDEIVMRLGADAEDAVNKYMEGDAK